MVSSPALVAVRALASRVDSSHWLCVFSFLVSLTTTVLVRSSQRCSSECTLCEQRDHERKNPGLLRSYQVQLHPSQGCRVMASFLEALLRSTSFHLRKAKRSGGRWKGLKGTVVIRESPTHFRVPELGKDSYGADSSSVPFSCYLLCPVLH